MSNSIVAAIYRYVIDDVVRNVHADFEGHGVDTSVLEELQRSWEAKVIQSRVASFPGEDSINSPSHDVYANQFNARPATYHDYAGPAGAHNINSAASLASIINNPESMAPSAASLASLAQSGRGQLLLDDDEDADSDHQQASHHHRYNGPNNNIPQNDGADEPVPVLALPADAALAKWQAIRDSRRQTYQHNIDAWTNRDRSAVGQVDGASDDEDEDEDDEEDDNNNANSHVDDRHRAPIATFGSGKVEAPEDAINSDLDDTDEEDDIENNNEESDHVVLCQYEKVTRSKNKWKCVLRDGIMLINGRDYLFQKATGEFEW
ncbi:transcription factor IIA subunit alpha [Coemansia aciculifera]|uniref:Transcription initiation factor IIA large subunit n=1 Tax=Coemansia aciculifera TaxID=417176 RepID=A0A9W8M6I9_9FUNG|nr:transcription factor IIA subunit alpha [Coemansia aciculifera]